MIIGGYVFLPDTPRMMRKWRAELGYSQAQAASVLGVTKNAVYRYEAGTRKISKSIALLASHIEEMHYRRKVEIDRLCSEPMTFDDLEPEMTA